MKFTKFTMKAPVTELPSLSVSADRQMTEAMQQNSITAPPVITADGHIHRFGKDNVCWYVLYPETDCGCFGDWSSNLKVSFHPAYSRPLSEAEKAQLEANIQQAEKNYTEQALQRQKDAAQECERLWNSLPEACYSHPYLEKKGVKSTYGCRQNDTDLVVPVMNYDGKIQSLQFISPEGKKKFYPGAKMKGGYWILGSGYPAYLVEGFATAASVYQETGKTCLIAYNAGNLTEIAKLFPYVTIIADNDESGTGEQKAKETGLPYILCEKIEAEDSDANDYVQHGGDLCRMLGTEKPKKVFRSLSSVIQMPSPQSWLIRNLIPSGAKIGMVFGASGHGKTYFAIDWMLSIATSQKDWNGLKVMPGKVLYLCGEGHQAAYERMAVWLQQKKIKDIPDTMYISEETFSLDDPNGLTALRVSLEHELENFTPSFAVVDTLNLFMQGDENNTQESTAFIKGLKELSQQFGCCIMLVHHTGVGDQDRSRGSSVFKGAMDFQVKVSKESVNCYLMEHVKNKAGKETEPMRFSLEEHDVIGWIDPDSGEPVTNAVLVKSENEPEDKMPGRKPDRDFVYFACVSTRRLIESKDPFFTITQKELREYGSHYWADPKKAARETNPNQERKTLSRLITAGILTETAPDTYSVVLKKLREDIFKRLEYKRIHAMYNVEGQCEEAPDIEDVADMLGIEK